jgi:hypothetical protein
MNPPARGRSSGLRFGSPSESNAETCGETSSLHGLCLDDAGRKMTASAQRMLNAFGEHEEEHVQVNRTWVRNMLDGHAT